MTDFDRLGRIVSDERPSMLNIDNWTEEGRAIMDFEMGRREQTVLVTQSHPNRIPVAVICKNTLMRTGMNSILAHSRFELLEGSYDLSGASDHRPLLFMICDEYPGEELARTIETIKEQHPSARVVVLGDNLATSAIVGALEAGMNGLCASTMDRHALVTVLELVMLGEIYIPIAVALQMGSPAACPSQNQGQLPAMLAGASMRKGGTHRLSDREVEILHHLVSGAQNKVIARSLDITESTIKVHVKAILRKIGASNRTQAAIWATSNLAATTGREPALAAE
jgi:two-component system nitrate/nitrite response regulator NarL